MTQKWFKKQLSVWASVASGRARILIIRMFVMGTESTFVVWRKHALQQPRELSATHRCLFALCVQFKYGANAECPSAPQPCQESNTHVLPRLGGSCKRPLIGSVTSWAAVEAVRAHAVTSWLPCNIQGGRNTDMFRRSPYPIGGDSACEPNYL